MSAINDQILRARLAEFNAVAGPRVGDFLQLPRLHPELGDITRFTHHWGDRIQTGGTARNAYYLAGRSLSYSGSLDAGVATADVLPDPVGERDGMVYFFNEGVTGAGRGVNFEAKMRVWALRDGADLSGIGELRCPYYLYTYDEKRHKDSCNYWYAVTKNGMSHKACTTETQLREWLASEGLALVADLPARGVWSAQNLKYSTP